MSTPVVIEPEIVRAAVTECIGHSPQCRDVPGPVARSRRCRHKTGDSAHVGLVQKRASFSQDWVN
jgi:hypothetical protein